METRPSISNPPSLSGPDDEGFWMEEDFGSMAATVQDSKPSSQIPAAIGRYRTTADAEALGEAPDEGPDEAPDEGPDEDPSDEVFVPPQPAEGAVPAEDGNTCVTLANGAADATDDAANPGSLPWHHGAAASRVAHGETTEAEPSTADQEEPNTAGDPRPGGPRHVVSEDLRREAMEQHKSSEEEPSDTEADQKEVGKRAGKVRVGDLEGPEGGAGCRRDEKVWGIATKIKQGEELLQRLQLVQRRQDEHGGEPAPTQNQAPQGGPIETIGLETGVGVASVTVEPPGIVGKEHSVTSFLAAKLWFSTPETERQTLQGDHPRSRGVPDLSEDPDVLEIPFKTPVVLEPEPDEEHPEPKHMETPKEVGAPFVVEPGQRFLQLKETKMLFETFQQASTGGPTRQRKTPSTQVKANLPPMVLERTRSLEGFSLDSVPVSRAHSLRLLKSGEKEKSPDGLRTRSPTGGPRDKTRLSPYPKQDVRLHRSMDSISASGPETPPEDKQDSPVLTRNPFFKLRPALNKQPMVEKDIREAREREEELRRQRCFMYRENHLRSKDPPLKSPAPELKPPTRGKLQGVWPPTCSKGPLVKESEQGSRGQRSAGQKSLWQRWESGQINSPQEHD